MHPPSIPPLGNFLSPHNTPGTRQTIGQLSGASMSLAIYTPAQAKEGWSMVVVNEMAGVYQLARELAFFRGAENLPIFIFPDWEILPYDHFSPHADIISERMATLHQLLQLPKGILLVSVNTLMHRLPPTEYLHGQSFVVSRGQKIDTQKLRSQLEKSGYRLVTQVMEHGEYAVRGSIFDIYPMGSETPYRLDLFDDEVESVRTFDPETQRTREVIEAIRLLPAHEFPLNEMAIAHFRQSWRERFHGNPLDSSLYQSISRGESAPGVEYYLPLFFEKLQSLLEYLPQNTAVITLNNMHQAATQFWAEVTERYDQLAHDIQRPILPPPEIFIPVEQLFASLKDFPQLQLQTETVAEKSGAINWPTKPLPAIAIDQQAAHPLHRLAEWLQDLDARVLFCSETAGRREVLENLLKDLTHPWEHRTPVRSEASTRTGVRDSQGLSLKFYPTWQDFLNDTAPVGICIAPLEQGFYLTDPPIAVLTEAQLFGPQVMQRRLRKRTQQDADAIVRDLTELQIGAPVVHIEHGVGRYLGLQTIQTGEQEAEYLMLEYAGGAKLYVPIAQLQLISRYSGTDVEHAPLHRLGSGQWDKIRRKASEKILDVAAELLEIYAQRAAKTGFAFKKPDQHYLAFAASFPFEETPDQARAISEIIEDLTSTRSSDRVVCGDVGFGKTEVAIRAAFLAVQSNKQVAVLVPTTLLAEQHLHTFQDRFAKWPIRVEAISRFRTKAEQTKILDDLKSGKVDVIVGTHKLLQETVKFHALGLLIVDEEHRFGVRQKERIKAMRAEVDLLTLTATPIPRTLNMALANIRDLSIIATPPSKRLAVKTFVREYQKSLVREAVMREILRGGQVYYLHNEVQTIERIREDLQALLPEARIAVAHGQMREQELERIMVDFYHQRFNVLLCTTIIESGIDIPTANTIIINRADCFGLAQLHQLRGRVGRSHHQAYAYLLTPPEDALTSDAKKRLTAIASLEDLGAGFTLATHDLEIRGAGELLGEEQSGHIQELGYTLYMELLEDTVKALKAGKIPQLDKSAQTGIEIDLKAPALIPEDYLPDVHSRLMLYKRIASAKNTADLQDLQIEMIDRFGLLPPQAKNLFRLTELKLQAAPLGVKKIQASTDHGVLEFLPNPTINTAALINLIQKQPQHYKLIGNEKLKFTFPMDSPEKRAESITKILATLETSKCST